MIRVAADETIITHGHKDVIQTYVRKRWLCRDMIRRDVQVSVRSRECLAGEPGMPGRNVNVPTRNCVHLYLYCLARVLGKSTLKNAVSRNFCRRTHVRERSCA